MKNYLLLSKYNNIVLSPLTEILDFTINLISKTHFSYKRIDYHIIELQEY